MAAGAPWPPSPHQQTGRLNAYEKKRAINPRTTASSRLFELLLTLIERSPSCHQARTPSRRLHASGKTHWSDTVGQDHWGGQLHQGDVVVESLWVELETLGILLFQ